MAVAIDALLSQAANLLSEVSNKVPKEMPFCPLSHISWSWEAPGSHLWNSLDQDPVFCQL